MDVVVGQRVIPFLAGAPVDRVAAHVADDILGIVEPAFLHVALGQPGARPAVDGRLRLIETAHISEGGGSGVEVALIELRATHEHPGLPQEGVILLTAQPFNVALRLAPLLVPHRPSLDTVQSDGFLCFLYGPVEVAFAELAALLVAHGVERYHLGEVILVAILLFE